MAEVATSERLAFSAASVPPSPRQRQAALATAAMLVLAFAALAPFATVRLLRIDSFVPAVEAIILLTDLATAVLLFHQFSILRMRALLVLASGYLFSALIIVPHILTFPGAFYRTGLLGAGLQSTAWLYTFWHLGFTATVIGYAWLKSVTGEVPARAPSRLPPVTTSVLAVVITVCALTWLVTAGESLLPRLFVDEIGISRLGHYVTGVNLAASVAALVLLWVRRDSLLDLWLMVAVCALVAELATVTLVLSGRFCLGFYLGRIFSLTVSTVVLAVLMTEMARQHAGLSRAGRWPGRERDSGLLNLQAAVLEIAHGVRQPLAAIALNGAAAQHLLARAPPEIDQVRTLHDEMVRDSFRANEVFNRIHALLGTSDHAPQPVDVNEVARAAVQALRRPLDDHAIETVLALAPDLPRVAGCQGQLQEVVANLVQNAIDAMDGMANGKKRVLRVATTRNGGETIALSVQDSGPGIAPGEIHRIFDGFVTTKEQRMGLGLAICRMVVERHAGRLSVTSDREAGTRFEVTLPVGPA
jgi:signal transduction histidine kinase